MASRPSVPSYNAGFYSPRRGGNPRYPSLWRGCVGAWCTSLGPTGSRLFDWSLYGNHGTLTNMDAATDWIRSPGGGGGYALDFDGSNDYLILPINGKNFSEVTFCWWVYHRSNVFFNWSNSPQSNTPFILLTTSKQWYVDGNYRYTATITDNTWVHVACTMASSGSSKIWTFYHNGVAQSTYTGSNAMQSYADNLYIGSGYFSNNMNGMSDEIRVYNRALTGLEVWTLSSRRGIAYELDYGFDAFGSAAAPPAPTSTSNLLLMGVG